ncbi:MAG: hypothetical protein FWE78_05885, partial [Methanimicrococcus sp.]|nr:hypothetical protein [Methanimicrococcus sp.]
PSAGWRALSAECRVAGAECRVQGGGHLRKLMAAAGCPTRHRRISSSMIHNFGKFTAFAP